MGNLPVYSTAYSSGEAVAQFAQRLGISVKTLQRWDREGRLKPSRTPSNRRVYTDEQLTHALQRQSALARDTVVCMRVSSQAHKPDLLNQRATLEQFCAARGLAVTQWISQRDGAQSPPGPGDQ
jgi:putative resolvase